MRRPIITQAWLADFYANGVRPKYRGSIKRQAASHKRLQPEVASDKPQASSDKRMSRQAPSDSRKDSKSSSDKQQAS